MKMAEFTHECKLEHKTIRLIVEIFLEHKNLMFYCLMNYCTCNNVWGEEMAPYSLT